MEFVTEDIDNNGRYKLRPRKKVDYFKRKKQYSKWIYCDKCTQWRRIERKFNEARLPAKWECSLYPYKGSCKDQYHGMEKAEEIIGETPDTTTLPQRRRRKPSNSRHHSALPSKDAVSKIINGYNRVVTTVNIFGELLSDFEARYFAVRKTPTKQRPTQRDPKHSRRPSTQNNLNGHDTPPSTENIFNDHDRRLLRDLPASMHRYIMKITDVPGDGNCGYHVVANGLRSWGFRLDKDNEASYIRGRMAAKLKQRREMFSKILFSENVDAMVERVEPKDNEDRPPQDRWMALPECGFLIAEEFMCTVHTLSTNPNLCLTFVPFNVGPPDGEGYKFMWMGVLGDHIIELQMKKGCPLPPLPEDQIYWDDIRTPASMKWRAKLEGRLNQWPGVSEVNEEAGHRRDGDLDCGSSNSETVSDTCNRR